MVCYSESNLAKVSVDLTAKSNVRKRKNYNDTGAITKITVHHMAGIMNAEQCAKMHQVSSKKQSANYYIGVGGEIVSGVPESRRAWTSGSATNDYKAITIEVSNSRVGDPWPVSDESWNALVELCVDICRRNQIDKLFYTGDKSGNLTIHKMFQNTTCPGPWLEKRMSKLTQQVNAKLEQPEAEAEYYTVKRGDTLTKICYIFDTTIAQLVKLNNIKNVNRIYVGQQLRVR